MTDPRARAPAMDRWEDSSSRPWGGVGPAVEPVATPVNGNRHRLAQLVRTIEAEVVPRLVLARRAAATAEAAEATGGTPPMASDVTTLAQHLVADDQAGARALVEAVMARGASTEAVYLGLLTGAARLLGQWWEEDRASFTDVTIGLCRLHALLHELSASFMAEGGHVEHGRRALLVPVPGEQHTFGLLMVAEFFRRAGWVVSCAPSASIIELTRQVRSEWFAVAGFSASSQTKLDDLAHCIRSVRRASRNQALGVLVGGPIFIEHPELVARVGADATAVDGRQAALQAHNLLALLAPAS